MSVTFPGGEYSGSATYTNQGNGNWILKITGNGKLTLSKRIYVDMFMVGGGGGGGTAQNQNWWGNWGGGGGGGASSSKKYGLSPSIGENSVTIGGGGSPNSGGGTTTALGFSVGGGGGGEARYASGNGGNGGYCDAEVQEMVNPSNGSGGVKGFDNNWYAGGGGGGTGAGWGNQGNTFRGDPGSGASGGGSGGGYWGGAGSSADSNTGSGGGGGGCQGGSGGYGGSGVVILRNYRVDSDTHKLKIIKDEGCVVSVERIVTTYSEKGVVYEESPIYNGDTLKISFTPKANYKLIETKVNGVNFSSGNTQAVNKDVTIKCVSQPLISNISASDADIGDTSTISLVRYGKTYTHKITYKFGGLSGVIINNYARDTYSWTIPSSFYNQIKNAASGVCTITCETFDNGKSLGTSTTNITVTANYDKSKPLITCTIEDIDPVTTYLTQSTNILIRNRSDARCKITATPRNSATITQLAIGKNTISDGSTSYTVSLEDFSGSTIVFSATDSRGYTTSETISPTVVDYINLSCYADLNRVSPTSGDITLNVHGDFFWQDFTGTADAISNELFLSFRYRENTESAQYSMWYTIPQTNIVKTYTDYQSSSPIMLNDLVSPRPNFDYKKAYRFQIRAQDGVTGHILSTVIASEAGSGSIVVNTGRPVFDWGEDDFNFNVPVSIGDAQGVTIGEESLSEETLRNLKSLYPPPDPPEPPKPQTISKTYKGSLPKGSWGSIGDGFYKQTLATSGLKANHNIIVDVDLTGLTPKQCTDANDAWGAIIKVETANNVLTFISIGVPAVGLSVKVMEIFK